jgi:hypothetical protein
MDDNTKTHLEELFGYTHRTDLRVIALQLAVAEFLKFAPEQKEKFDKLIELHYQSLLRASMEKTEDIDPALAARLIDGQNPYSKA